MPVMLQSCMYVCLCMCCCFALPRARKDADPFFSWRPRLAIFIAITAPSVVQTKRSPQHCNNTAAALMLHVQVRKCNSSWCLRRSRFVIVIAAAILTPLVREAINILRCAKCFLTLLAHNSEVKGSAPTPQLSAFAHINTSALLPVSVCMYVCTYRHIF